MTKPVGGLRKLCFGGSFNPIHHGHLICARAVVEAAGFDKIVLIPSANPPHKPASTDLADAHHRRAMCRLAIADDNFFEIEELELQRTGPSYTIDTVRQLISQGWKEVYWLIGADMAKILPQWHQAESLLRETQFVLMARPGSEIDWQALPPAFRSLRQQVVPAPLIDISATEIRRRIAHGQSIRYLTPPAVEQYIRDQRLYRPLNAP
ncbi:MAG TPA: nicotinate (nicotinamide) nucleotide adenylyltransferase [Tepidisphaeraceae bacterium]|jgi:nicotinate-nucleotide adenylyltransferase